MVGLNDIRRAPWNRAIPVGSDLDLEIMAAGIEADIINEEERKLGPAQPESKEPSLTRSIKLT